MDSTAPGAAGPLCPVCHEYTYPPGSVHRQCESSPAPGTASRPPRIRVNYRGVLLCPFCDFEYTHLDLVQVAARAEDGPFTEIAVDAVTGGVAQPSPVSAPAGEIVGTGRRHRIAIHGWCEGCHRYFDLVFTQHKGETYAEIIPADRLCECSGCIQKREAARTPPLPATASPIEQQFWDAHCRLALPELKGLVFQHPVGRFRLDFALPEHKIGIELDGLRNHSSTADITRDHVRQRWLEETGWRITRFGGSEVHHDAESVVRHVARSVRRWTAP